MASSGATAEGSPRSDPGSLRGKMLSHLAQAVGQDGELNESVSAIAEAIESAIGDKHGVATKEYTGKGRSLVFNLKKNSELRRGVLDGSVSATWLVSASVADLATEALKQMRQESMDRYYGQRSLGQSDENVVGWAAGTTGKLEWSHKYEKEKEASAAAAARAKREEDESGAGSTIDLGDGIVVRSYAEGMGPPLDAEESAPADLAHEPGRDDEEADDLKAAESASEVDDEEDERGVWSPGADDLATPDEATPDEEEEDDDDGYVPQPIGAATHDRGVDRPAKRARDLAASGGGAPQPKRFAGGSGGGGGGGQYGSAMVRQASLFKVVAGCGIELPSDEAAARSMVDGALARVRTVAAAGHRV
jgi:hypothetical protein